MCPNRRIDLALAAAVAARPARINAAVISQLAVNGDSASAAIRQRDR